MTSLTPPTPSGGPNPGSRAFLEDEGFEGFFTVGQLHADGCEGLPNEPGVYAMVRGSIDRPDFLARSAAPSYRGEDPTRPVDELKQRWVPDAQVLYVGPACGPGVRSRLRQRVKRYLRFGHGRVVGHWGGRFVWQLRDHATLRVAWKSTGVGDPARYQARLLARFREYYCMLPFANQVQESEE
jgi:hypothetical protein